ncbi:MAG: DUF4124 domain-containing protein [Sulfuricellaceae bacterium]
MNIKLLLLIGGCLSVAGVHAEIYKHIDETGRVTYTNTPIKGAIKLNLGPDPSAPVAKPKTATPTHASSPSPANFPKVDADTQKARDAMRYKILEEEMTAELKLLSEAKQTLAETEAANSDKGKLPAKHLERLQQLKDNMMLHVKNIQALKIEIANLKR